MRPLPELLQECRSRGVKLTPQRLCIFECLRDHPGHPTAEDVYQEVHRRHPATSFATVYNTLQLLTDLGELREVIVDELRRRYDVNTHAHAHAICGRCRRIVDLPLAGALEQARSEALTAAALELNDLDFVAQEAALEFTGLCGPCARGAADARTP